MLALVGRLTGTAARRRGSAATACAGLLLATACAPSALAQPSWPAPSDPMALAADAGLEATDREYLETHTHAHLDVLVDGVPIPVPSGIGIDIAAPEGVSHETTDDGTGISHFVSQCAEACLSPLHTHEPGGILHTESIEPVIEPFTLGQFFTEWGVTLDESCVGEFCTPDTSVAVYVNGETWEGNPADIPLNSHDEIAIIIGTAPTEIPSEWEFFERA